MKQIKEMHFFCHNFRFVLISEAFLCIFFLLFNGSKLITKEKQQTTHQTSKQKLNENITKWLKLDLKCLNLKREKNLLCFLV